MAGILDKKSRIMDVIITQEGRRQMASGKLRAEYLSFTDSQAFYEPDIASGSADATKRIYFEATSKLNDMITLESDDSGNLVQFDFSPKNSLIGNKLFTVTSSSPDLTNYRFRVYDRGASFASVGEKIATASINNFKNQYMIGTRNGENADLPGDGFTLDKNSLKFNIKNFMPFPGGAWKEKINIDAIEPLFTDKRLSHLPNFKFLPPVTPTGALLGDYKSINEAAPLTYADFRKNLGVPFINEPSQRDPLDPFNQKQQKRLLKNFKFPEGIEQTKEFRTIDFKSTSLESNIVCQMFELNNNQFKKLDIIDFGIFNDDQDESRPEKHVFFLGKVFIDSNGVPTFVNLFTIIMD